MKTKLILLSAFFLFTATVFAFDFVIDNVAYNITSPNTVETTWNDGFLLSGNISIPSQVVFSSVTYDVTAIGPNTFNGCGDLLTSVSIPQSVTSIGHYAFYGCSGLTTITIPSGVTYIGERGFFNCSKLTSLTIPAALPRIYSEVFTGCESVVSVNFESPSSLTQIDFAAFEYCGKITTLNIPSSVTSIADRAFQYCGSLATINIPNSVISMGVYAFDDTPWYYNQPEGLVYVGKVAYVYKGTMPENTSIVLNEDTKGIASYAFNSQQNLKAITIPASVRVIGRNSFEYCNGLNSIYAYASIPIDLSTAYSAFKDANKTTSTLYVPVDSRSAYMNAEQWQDFTNIVESTFTTLPNINTIENIFGAGNNIIIKNTERKPVSVFEITGRKLFDIKNPDETLYINVDKSGVYIVSVAERFTKILVK